MSQTPESIDDLLAIMTPEICSQLKTAVELGRWENGDKLSAEQIAHCLQAIIAYDEAFNSPEQRVGYIQQKNCSGRDRKNRGNNG